MLATQSYSAPPIAAPAPGVRAASPLTAVQPAAALPAAQVSTGPRFDFKKKSEPLCPALLVLIVIPCHFVRSPSPLHPSCHQNPPPGVEFRRESTNQAGSHIPKILWPSHPSPHLMCAVLCRE